MRDLGGGAARKRRGRSRHWCRIDGVDLRLALPVVILLGVLAGMSAARWTTPEAVAARVAHGPACRSPVDAAAAALCSAEAAWHASRADRRWR